MPKWMHSLSGQLEALGTQSLQRTRLCTASPQGARIVIDGKELDNFSSNDYLGLANHPAVVEAFCSAASRYGVGAGASHLVCGHCEAHEELEQALARFTGRERALLFSSGYMANMAVLRTLAGRGDSIFQDKLNHASLIDGGLASGAAHYRYRHLDMDHLAALLTTRCSGQSLIVSDAVFSMDGDCAPLQSLAAIACDNDAILVADDAHGFGVLGASGAGLAEAQGITPQQLPVLVATLGKAFGVQGAFVAGSAVIVETLLQKARQYIYTTALPPASATAALAALRVCQREPARREHLVQLIEQFRSGCNELGLGLLNTGNIPTAIQPLLVGDNRQAMRIAAGLRERGILAIAIRPPTVPAGTARIRISLTAAHSAAQVDRLLECLRDLLPLFQEQRR